MADVTVIRVTEQTRTYSVCGRLIRVEPFPAHGFVAWEVGTLLPTGYGPSISASILDLMSK